MKADNSPFILKAPEPCQATIKHISYVFLSFTSFLLIGVSAILLIRGDLSWWPGKESPFSCSYEEQYTAQGTTPAAHAWTFLKLCNSFMTSQPITNFHPEWNLIITVKVNMTHTSNLWYRRLEKTTKITNTNIFMWQEGKHRSGVGHIPIIIIQYISILFKHWFL